MMFPTDRLDSGHVRRLTVKMTFLNRSNEDIRRKQRHAIQIGTGGALSEQLSVSSRSDEHDQAMLSTVIKLVHQQKITSDMTFAIPCYVAA